MATYVISDIHGCFEEFQAMLSKISLSSEDRLYLAGDYIDRGEQSLAMLRWLEKCPENVFPIKGNHDSEFIENIRIMRRIDQSEKLETDPDSVEDTNALFDSVEYVLKRKDRLALMYFDYYGTIASLILKDGVTFRELCHFADMLSEYPYFYRFPIGERDCIIVHAGYCEDNSAIRGDYDSIEDFYLYAREDAIKLGGVRKGLIISGHTPTIAEGTSFYTDGEVFRYYDAEKDCIFYDIDCGCVYYKHGYPSGTLACIRTEDEEVFYLS